MLDAGTGARLLGQELIENDNDIYFFLTHTHWDHIQGFPFFAPIYQTDRKIYLSHIEQRRGLFKLLLEQMDGRRFPVTQDGIASILTRMSRDEVKARSKEGYRIDRLRVNHPGEAYGFSFNMRDRKIVYIPDNEIDPPYDPIVDFEDLVTFCKGADVLIHDAQYRLADMPAKKGWGHSVVDRVRELALEARVKQLVLFHHDPDRTDAELDALQRTSESWFSDRNVELICRVAYEGLELTL